MPLNKKEQTAIKRHIKALIADHIARPFAILRERGQVAALRGRLSLSSKLSASVKAHLLPRTCNIAARPNTARRVDVNRIQLDITAVASSPPDQPARRKTVDLVVLRREPLPSIYFARRDGDVIQQLDPRSLAAAIEVKASPSSDRSAGGEYAKDICSLLWLADAYGISAYFVLFDKSDGFYGIDSPNERCRVLWWDSRIARAFTLRYRNLNLEMNLSRLGIEFGERRPSGKAYVQVWLPLRRDRKWAAHRFFASLCEGRANFWLDPVDALKQAGVDLGPKQRDAVRQAGATDPGSV